LGKKVSQFTELCGQKLCKVTILPHTNVPLYDRKSPETSNNDIHVVYVKEVADSVPIIFLWS